MADFSGNRLLIDPSISETGDFFYEDIAWSKILEDIAARNNLLVTVGHGTLTVTRQDIHGSRPAAARAGPSYADDDSTRFAKIDALPLTLRSRSQPVALMLGTIAGIYARALEIDPTIDAVGDFDYAGVALPTALADIEARFGLQIDLKPRLMTVKRR